MRAKSREGGFSLLELIVAMAITLIISGAIYGLMAGGQNAFRREPALTDRQQNIRTAMALIQSDLQVAGQGLAPMVQVFLAGNEQGPDTPTSVVDFSQGEKTDVLSLYSDTGMCPHVDLQDGKAAANGGNLNSTQPIPDCYPEDALLMVIYPGTSGPALKPGFAHNIHAQDTMVNFPPGKQPPTPYSLIQGVVDLDNPETPVSVAVIEWVRWQIANEDPACTANCVPALYRTNSGGWDIVNGVATTPGTPGGDWQLVARGIEDLQVQYRTAASTAATPANPWLDDPPDIANSYNNIVQEVRVTLSARTTDPRFQGSTTEEGVTALRGQLVSSTSPRSALIHLAQRPASALPAPGGPVWR